MGVDYSAVLGYGIAIEEDEFNDSTTFEPYWEDDGESIQDWLDQNGLDKVEFEIAGNYMSGETFIFFYLTGTHERIDWREADGVRDFSTYVSPRDREQIFKVWDELDRSVLPGWKLIFNVS